MNEPKQHRSIFYKGDSHASTGRTPSVWLFPDTNRMTIRVSTEKEPDVAITNFLDVPMFEWTLLSFVFRNSSFQSNNHDCRKLNNEIRESMVDAKSRGVDISTEINYYFLSSSSNINDMCCISDDASNMNFTHQSEFYRIEVYQNDQLDIRYSVIIALEEATCY